VVSITQNLLYLLAAAQGGTAQWNSANPFEQVWDASVVIAACLFVGCFIQAWNQYRKER
jgi:hypothetical protein